MKYTKPLLVTFPVDLGNRTIESNLQEIFLNDFDFFRFAEKHASSKNLGKIKFWESIWYRIVSTYKLRRVVKKYTGSGNIVIFNSLSPALFSVGIWNRENAVIVFDWTRTLHPFILNQPIKKGIIFYIQRYVINKCSKILCCTDSIFRNINEVYGVSKTNLYKVPAPFNVENMNFFPRPTNNIPKVLFVGGDLKRKGGDLLIKRWQAILHNKCSLTMMTKDQSANIEGVNFLPNVEYGTDEHRKIFEAHDILILPTVFDAYPQVIGEAAAAGLAIVTTKQALVAKEILTHGISGYVAESAEECLDLLESLLDNHQLIDEFKIKGYTNMHQKFSKSNTRISYLNAIGIK